MIISHPRYPSQLCQDPDSISWTFLEQFVLVKIIQQLFLNNGSITILGWKTIFIDVNEGSERSCILRSLHHNFFLQHTIWLSFKRKPTNSHKIAIIRLWIITDLKKCEQVRMYQISNSPLEEDVHFNFGCNNKLTGTLTLMGFNSSKFWPIAKVMFESNWFLNNRDVVPSKLGN